VTIGITSSSKVLVLGRKSNVQFISPRSTCTITIDVTSTL